LEDLELLVSELQQQLRECQKEKDKAYSLVMQLLQPGTAPNLNPEEHNNIVDSTKTILQTPWQYKPTADVCSYPITPTQTPDSQASAPFEWLKGYEADSRFNSGRQQQLTSQKFESGSLWIPRESKLIDEDCTTQTRSPSTSPSPSGIFQNRMPSTTQITQYRQPGSLENILASQDSSITSSLDRLFLEMNDPATGSFELIRAGFAIPFDRDSEDFHSLETQSLSG
jgi:hypothetical protein